MTKRSEEEWEKELRQKGDLATSGQRRSARIPDANDVPPEPTIAYPLRPGLFDEDLHDAQDHFLLSVIMYDTSLFQDRRRAAKFVGDRLNACADLPVSFLEDQALLKYVIGFTLLEFGCIRFGALSWDLCFLEDTKTLMTHPKPFTLATLISSAKALRTTGKSTGNTVLDQMIDNVQAKATPPTPA